MLTIKHGKAKTLAVSAVDTTSYDKMAKAELSLSNNVVLLFCLKFGRF